MEFTSEMQDKLIDMRFAFERDLVRRKGLKVFARRGIIAGCVVCGEDFDAKTSNEITCSPECKRKRHAQRNQKYRDANREELNAKRRKEGV